MSEHRVAISLKMTQLALFQFPIVEFGSPYIPDICWACFFCIHSDDTATSDRACELLMMYHSEDSAQHIRNPGRRHSWQFLSDLRTGLPVDHC
jgi:hypothetical protein